MKQGDGLLEVAIEMLRVGYTSAWAEWHIDTVKWLNGCIFVGEAEGLGLRSW